MDDVEEKPGPPPAAQRRWRKRLADEREEAKVYRDLATRRTGEERAILLGLADAEERHAAHWTRLLGGEVGAVRRGSTRMRALAFLARRFGSVFVLALAQRAETRSPYADDADATPAMAADERIHEEVVRGLAARGRNRVSGTFRAAVFGANDGLVSNLALVLGVIGGGAGTKTVLLTGLAGILAGALSMGAGEFVSVRSQRELLAASAPDTRDAETVLRRLDVDANELALVFRARGMGEEEARIQAGAVLSSEDPAGAVARGVGTAEGLDVVGSSIGAALSSFCFFATGAAIPVLPFLFGLGETTALVVAVVLVGLALMLTGATVGVLSGGPPLRRALRQLVIGLGAAAVTYSLGLLFGAALG
ncbi:MAG: vacuolar iron transporter family protein [Pseudonocardiales bacterium]|nr:vacuolar iron transporter family protein [Pseudonocardiales bacterium]